MIKLRSLKDPSWQYGLIFHRIRIYPGIIGATDTVIDCYLDLIQDIACHPLYQERGQAFQPGNDRQRHRSVPVHRLHQELPTHLNLEPDSVQDFNETPGVARGTVSSRRHRRDVSGVQSSVGQLLNDSDIVSTSRYYTIWS